jgi:hypothetical protein
MLYLSGGPQINFRAGRIAPRKLAHRVSPSLKTHSSPTLLHSHAWVSRPPR